MECGSHGCRYLSGGTASAWESGGRTPERFLHMQRSVQRRRSIGAEVFEDGVHFRVWAPAHDEVAVIIDGRAHALDREERGYFSALIRGAKAGTRYKFRLGDGDYPDPASRFQPEGPHGASEVVEARHEWRSEWRGITQKPVLYEMHAGTFTKEGTYAAAERHLPRLAEIGITVIELMPIGEFPGEFGWGYDGVGLYAPSHLYGRPDDLRHFIDAAHANGIAVILDVVYNHFGPDGCYLAKFTPDYFTDRYVNDWGASVNFDGEDAHGVRELIAENAAYWIDEFRVDGLRLDATQSIFDSSEKHILREITDRARAAAGGRNIFIVAENEPQDTKLLREYGINAMWNDDWHHAARVAATGFIEAYYTDYRGRPQEFVSMATLGFLYQGQYYSWQKDVRGTPSHDIPPERLVCFLENHDQVANSATGARLHQLAPRRKVNALTALLLLLPQTPMLFQGQELGAKTPFLYFADHKPELAAQVREGRLEFLAQFPSLRGIEIDVPESRATFERCKLDHDDRDEELESLHRDLLALRRDQPFDAEMHGAVLGDDCLAFRWFAGGTRDRLLILHLGDVQKIHPQADPVLAPPSGYYKWERVWAADGAELLRPA